MKMKSFLLLAVVLALSLSGCAFTQQHVRTMDNDRFDQVGGALFSKQAFTQGLDADFYPNDSGAHIAVKGQGDQDSTASLATINALVSAFTQMQAAQAGAPAPVPSSTTSRLDTLTAQIESLRTLIDSLRSK